MSKRSRSTSGRSPVSFTDILTDDPPYIRNRKSTAGVRKPAIPWKPGDPKPEAENDNAASPPDKGQTE